MTKDELIAALEKAEGPSRELDCYIWAAVNGKGQAVRIVGEPAYSPQRFFCNPNSEIEWLGYDLLNVAPAYTASIDAALTLVPDNHTVYLTRPNLHTTGTEALRMSYACVAPPGLGGPQYAKKRAHLSAHHRIAPVALCIAALRARP